MQFKINKLSPRPNNFLLNRIAIYKTLQYIKIRISTEKYNYDLFSREILVC